MRIRFQILILAPI